MQQSEDREEGLRKSIRSIDYADWKQRQYCVMYEKAWNELYANARVGETVSIDGKLITVKEKTEHAIIFTGDSFTIVYMKNDGRGEYLIGKAE